MNLKLVSEDSRRRLYELGVGGMWQVVKYLEIKSECEIGNHLHRNKDELFFLVKGALIYVLKENGIEKQGYIDAPNSIFVPRNMHHTFLCETGTLLLCLATELHDDNDDIKL